MYKAKVKASSTEGYQLLVGDMPNGLSPNRSTDKRLVNKEMKDQADASLDKVISRYSPTTDFQIGPFRKQGVVDCLQSLIHNATDTAENISRSLCTMAHNSGRKSRGFRCPEKSFFGPRPTEGQFSITHG